MNVAQRLCLRRILNLCLEHASLKAWDYEAKGNKWTTFFAKIQIEREGAWVCENYINTSNYLSYQL